MIVGPTAVGKSQLALTLARAFGGEIVSADSRQIYRYMDVGTAKPTLDERQFVCHHLIDVVNPDEEYTLARFQADAYQAIDSTLAQGRLPLLVGGSGLYVRSVVDGLHIPRVEPNPVLRGELEERVTREGGLALHADLTALDPVAAGRIDPRNVRRVIRALEVCLLTGNPISQLQRASPPPYDMLTVGLTTDRDALYRRIDERVDLQIGCGLVEENRRLVAMGYSYLLPAMSGLGYRQIGTYLRGEVDLSRAVEILKYETHRFARQQYAWFRPGDQRIAWLRTEPGFADVASDLVDAFLRRYGSLRRAPAGAAL